MNIAGKYNNYDPHPKKVIPGFEDQAWEGVPAVKAELIRRAEDILSREKRAVLCLDFYPGVAKEELMELALSLNPAKIMDMEDYAKSEEVLNREFHDFITEDRVFGVICHKKLADFFDRRRRSRSHKQRRYLRLLWHNEMGNPAALPEGNAQLALHQQ